MNVRRRLLVPALALSLAATTSVPGFAQGGRAGAAGPAAGGQAGPAPAAPIGGGGGGRGNFVPEPVPPPQNFKTSTEHYEFLLRLHKGGTRHTYETVPKWEGLWSAAGNTSTGLFLKGT